MKHPETLEPVLDFLSSIEMPWREGDVPPDSFLPGIRIEAGALIFQAESLLSPGDLLHEAGHLATIPSHLRGHITGDVDACLAGLEGTDAVSHTDLIPIAWSYTAALHAGIDPILVFDAAGYGADQGGDVSNICNQLQMGLFPGIAMLSKLGLCSAPPPFGDGQGTPYPHMTRWVMA